MNGCIRNEYRLPHTGGTGTSVAAAVTPSVRPRAAVRSVRRFAHALLATMLCTLIVVADRMVDAWSSEGLVMALVVLWLVLFVGLSLLSGLSIRLALWVAAAWQDSAPGHWNELPIVMRAERR